MSEEAFKLGREESLDLLEQLWGKPGGSLPERQADAWARRSLGLPSEQGDAELLHHVDAQTAAAYGLPRAS